MPTRVLTILHPPTQTRIALTLSSELWSTADRLRERFNYWSDDRQSGQLGSTLSISLSSFSSSDEDLTPIEQELAAAKDKFERSMILEAWFVRFLAGEAAGLLQAGGSNGKWNSIMNTVASNFSLQDLNGGRDGYASPNGNGAKSGYKTPGSPYVAIHPHPFDFSRVQTHTARQRVDRPHSPIDSPTSPSSGPEEDLTADVLRAVFDHFVQTYFVQDPPHVVAGRLDIERKAVVVKAFYMAKTVLETAEIGPGRYEGEGDAEPPKAATGKLLDGKEEEVEGVEKTVKRKKEILAVFGGQGPNLEYWEEIESLASTYPTILGPFYRTTSIALARFATNKDAAASHLYVHGLDFINWLAPLSDGANANNGDSKPKSERPPVEYLASCPVSLPLIGVAQLARWIVVGRAEGLRPAEYVKRFCGTTGHSQGIVSAAIIALIEERDTWESFYSKALKALEVLFWIGYHSTIAFPPSTLPPHLLAQTASEGSPSPMLAVVGISEAMLNTTVQKTNKELEKAGEGTVEIRLKNGLKAFTVVGPPKSLVGLVGGLKKIRAEIGKDQNKVPFSKRLPVFSMRFLPIGVPYHSPYLSACSPALATSRHLSSCSPTFNRSKLLIPVYSTLDGRDLRTPSPTDPSQSLVDELCTMIFTQALDWTKAVDKENVTHVVDFGPGGATGIGSLTKRVVDGKGVRVVVVGANGEAGEEVWKREVKWEKKWGEEFGVALVKTRDGEIRLDTKMSRMLSKAPMMVPGMTPTTVQAGFVTAVLNAGYHVELAGGGQFSPEMVRDKVNQIMKKLDHPGIGITLNCLYINPFQWGFQFPLWLEMKREGLPIEGLCVAAGVPTPDKADEIIKGLKDVGIKHVAFKPGSVDGIKQVVAIAASHPDFPVMLQWTGGRGGGHHSPEDMHQPILSTYSAIRSAPNLVLIAGSGFGGVDDVYPYLTGEWSLRFGVPPMPFDGALYGSRVMVAKEAHTAQKVKELIVQAKGVEDHEWEGTYERETGGIITVRSELGEPIHKIATRGIKFWKELDDTVFNLPREKRAAWCNEPTQKAKLIQRLNADFQKPWFPATLEGEAKNELGEMTYEEVTMRLLKLMFVKHQKRWGDISWRLFFGDWIRLTEQRLSPPNPSKPIESVLQSYEELNDPYPVVENFFKRFPKAKDQVIASEDIQHFLTMCTRPIQKPVPFVPVFDAGFEFYFKKDSLHYSEDLDLVFDQDPQRVCILQGPISCKYSTRTDQPIKELLGEIESSLISKVLANRYSNDPSLVPTVDYLGLRPTAPRNPTTIASRHGISHSIDSNYNGGRIYTFHLPAPPAPASTSPDSFEPVVLPDPSEWIEDLAGPALNWLRAFLASPNYVREDRYTGNAARKVLQPRWGQKVRLEVDKEGRPLSLRVFGGARNSVRVGA